MRELQVQIMSYHWTTIRRTKIKKNLTQPNPSTEAQQKEPTFIAGGNVKWDRNVGRQAVSHKPQYSITTESSNHTPTHLPK